MSKQYGIIKNVFKEEQLDEWCSVFKKLTTTNTSTGDKCYGIDINNLAYKWFLKKMLPDLQIHFEEHIKLIFSAFINLETVLPIHDDIKPIPNNAVGKHFVSILIPFSIDENKNIDFSKVGTCFYDAEKNLIERVGWDKGCLLWWNSNLLHSSSDFKKEGVSSKQYWITHTYV